jgi:hypothetical protein
MCINGIQDIVGAVKVKVSQLSFDVLTIEKWREADPQLN